MQITLHTASMKVERVPEVYFVDVVFGIPTEELSDTAQRTAAESAAIKKTIIDQGLDPDEYMASVIEMQKCETIEVSV